MSNKRVTKPKPTLSFLLFSILLSLLCLLLFFTVRYWDTERDTQVVASSSKKITVILDPGHGGEDGGAVGNKNVYEKDLNLAIAKDVESYLKMSGISVICTRNEDVLLYDKNANYKGRKKMLDLATRLKISRETENSVFVSIHMNSFPQTQYRGLQVYYSKNNEASDDLAALIQNNTKSLLQTTNTRKIKQASSNIYLLDRIETPAILVECGFLSNTEECTLLCDEEYRKKLALILADSIVEFVENNS